MKKDSLFLIILVSIGLFSRLISHQWNLTAMGAVSILAGLLISNRYMKLAVPVCAMLISDYWIGFHNTVFFVYFGFLMMTLISEKFKDAHLTQKLFLAPFVSSLIFFFISNFGVWYVGGYYLKNFIGLMECFMMGIPFYRAQFLADLMLTPVLFYMFVHLPNFSCLADAKRT